MVNGTTVQQWIQINFKINSNNTGIAVHAWQLLKP